MFYAFLCTWNDYNNTVAHVTRGHLATTKSALISSENSTSCKCLKFNTMFPVFFCTLLIASKSNLYNSCMKKAKDQSMTTFKRKRKDKISIDISRPYNLFSVIS